MNNLKFILFAFISIMIVSGSNVLSQDNNNKQKENEPEWEMKTYYFVFLNSNPERPKIDSVKSAEIQAGHLANIQKMFDEGKCRLAGPFLDDGETRGIFILDVASVEEAKELLSNDPAINSGRLIPVIKPWYGPAGLIVERKARK